MSKTKRALPEDVDATSILEPDYIPEPQDIPESFMLLSGIESSVKQLHQHVASMSQEEQVAVARIMFELETILTKARIPF